MWSIAYNEWQKEWVVCTLLTVFKPFPTKKEQKWFWCDWKEGALICYLSPPGLLRKAQLMVRDIQRQNELLLTSGTKQDLEMALQDGFKNVNCYLNDSTFRIYTNSEILMKMYHIINKGNHSLSFNSLGVGFSHFTF